MHPWLVSARTAHVGLQGFFMRETETRDDFPDVVLAGGAHVFRKTAERRRAPHNRQCRAIERRIAGTALNANAAFLVVNRAVLEYRYVHHQLTVQLLAILLRKVQGTKLLD